MSDFNADESRWSGWLARAQAGDEEAYGALLGELAPVIRAYLTRRLGASELIDDCVQESLIAIHEGRHSYDPSRPVRPWLFAIIRHRAIDVLRRQPTGQIEAEEAAAAETPDLNAPLDGARLLSGLSRELRDALVLTKLWGFSVKESANRLGVSESLVKVRVHRGLRKLRTRWESEAT